MNRQHPNKTMIILVFALALLTVQAQQACAQSDAELQWRVEKLEKYVETFQPTMNELSNNLNASINEYTRGLEQSLESYSQKLQVSLDDQLKSINRKSVVLNPYSQGYQSIATNTGNFLISVRRVESLEEGVRLHINVGNPNYADYQNFQLKFIWGDQWGGEYVEPYRKWRQSLYGAEYSFQGKLERGKWNSVTVDLNPTNGNAIGYLECEMTVSSVELGS